MIKTLDKISKVGYVNRIGRNIATINRGQVADLYQELKAADCVICSGSGRSLFSLNAAMSQIALSHIGWRNKVVLTPDDPGFPGKNMYEAAAELQRRYKKILLLINSGSGFSEDPLTMAQDLTKFMSEQRSTRFSMGLITSNPRSPLGKIVKENGTVLILRGRGRKRPSLDYSEVGIMGDIFELGSLFLLCMLTETLFRNLDISAFFELCARELKVIGSLIDQNLGSETYEKIVDEIESRSNIFLGGKGTANEIVKMAAVRLFHIKNFLGDHVYIARGVNTPHPRSGDLEILVSFSGETKPVIFWCDVMKKYNGKVLAITGNENSTLAKKSHFNIILNEEVKPGQPRRFYMRAAYVLSPLPVKLTERLAKSGLKLPEFILNWHHSVTQ